MVKYTGADLDLKFHALSDETRRTILVLVLTAPRTVGDIASRFTISMPAISKHLRTLESAGLIKRKRDGRTHFIQAVPGAFRDVGVLVAYYETFWKSALENLNTFMEKNMSNSIEVSRTISAPVERVYNAWTDPGQMAKWFTPMPGMSARVEADVTVGGAYKVVMILGDGTEMEHTGEYLVIDRQRMLKFTWNSPEIHDSVVTVAFEQSGADTVVTLTHEGLPDEESMNNHRGGWTYILECLDGAL